MDSKYQKTNQTTDYNNDLDFGLVLEKSFDNYKKIAGIAGIGMLLSSIVLIIVGVGIFGSMYGFANFAETLTEFSATITWSTELILLFAGAFFAAVYSPINAGFVQMARNANANENYGLDTLFSFYSSSFFKELFIAALLISLFGSILDFALTQMGVFYVGTVITILASFLTFLSIPLIIFNKMDALTSITTSIKLVLKNPLVIFGLLIVAIIVCMLGIFGLCIGLFFTFPFWYSMNYIIYSEMVPEKKLDALDEIGMVQE